MSIGFPPVEPPGVTAASAPEVAGTGSFAPLLELLAASRPDLPPAGRPNRARLVTFGTDHPIAELGVSAHPSAETGRRLAALRTGAGPVAAAAAVADVGIRVVELSSAELGDFGRLDIADALSEPALLAAIKAGRDAADAEVDEGADLLIGAVCSVGVSTPAAVLTASITGVEPVDATTRGSGIGDAAWIRKAAAVRDALYRLRLAGTDVPTLLRVGGGADLAALTGFIAQAAVRRTPVLVDDVPSTLCAILALRLAPGADAYVIATSLSAERTHRRLLDVLGRDPLTAWSIRAGGGVGALVTVSVIRALARVEAGDPDEARTADAVSAWDPDLL